MPSSSPSKKEDEEPTIPETMTEISNEEKNFGRKTQQQLANDRGNFSSLEKYSLNQKRRHKRLKSRRKIDFWKSEEI